jgi:hypothetical protein
MYENRYNSEFYVIETKFVISYLPIHKSFVSVRWELWNYAISGSLSNELSSINTLHEKRLYSRSQKVSSLQCIMCVLWVLIIFWCGYVKCSILYKINDLGLIICACYSWEMALTSAWMYHLIMGTNKGESTGK